MNFHAWLQRRGNDSLEYAKHSNKHLDIDIFHFDGQTDIKVNLLILFSASLLLNTFKIQRNTLMNATEYCSRRNPSYFDS